MPRVTRALPELKAQILGEVESEQERWRVIARYTTPEDWSDLAGRMQALAEQARRGWHLVDFRDALSPEGEAIVLLHFACPRG